MVKISKFGEDYFLLALRINKHIEGYVDYYYGPEKLHQLVENESPSSPNKLLKDSISLMQQLKSQGYNKEREEYLEKLLRAMKTSIEILNGAEIPVNEEFLNLYDVALKVADESELYDLKSEFEESYGCKGSLKEHFNQLEIQRRVPEKKLNEFFT